MVISVNFYAPTDSGSACKIFELNCQFCETVAIHHNRCLHKKLFLEFYNNL